MVIRILTLLTLISLCPQSRSEEVVKIPLIDIWANDMPGTKKFDFIKCNPSKDPDCPAVYSLLEAVQSGYKDKSFRPGFVVDKTDFEAMREAQRVIVDKKMPQSSFAAGTELIVVFFTTEMNDYLQLEPAQIAGKTISISFRIITNETEDGSSYLAFIPLGKLPNGEYHVNMVDRSDEQKFANAGRRLYEEERIRREICNPFSFTVGSKSESELSKRSKSQ
jgi:hypothetical protein